VPSRGSTLLELAVERGGYRKGTRVAVFVEQWVLVQQALGRPPATVEEAAAWWHEQPRQWYRRLAEFRELFPDHRTPSTIAGHIIDQANGRELERGSVLGQLATLTAS